MISEQDFLSELTTMPFHIIEKAEFEGRRVLITFRSGSQIKAVANNDAMYEILKAECLKNLKPEQVIIK